MYYFDKQGFIVTEEKEEDLEKYSCTDVEPKPSLRLPKFNEEISEWEEGILSHVWVMDEQGHFIYDDFNVDPRRKDFIFTSDCLESGTMNLPQYTGAVIAPGLVTGGKWVDQNPEKFDELDFSKSAAKAIIDTVYDKQRKKGVLLKVDGQELIVQTRDNNDITNLLRALTLASLENEMFPETDRETLLRGKDNIFTGFTYYDLKGVVYLVLGKLHSYDKIRWDLKKKIDDASSIEEVDSIEWPEL